MTYPLSESLRNTISKLDGWQVGTLIIENDNTWYLETKTDTVRITYEHTVQILNNDEWQTITQEYMQKKTAEGWPLLAGMRARIK